MNLMEKLQLVVTWVTATGARFHPAPPSRTPVPRGSGLDADGERGQGLAEYALILAGIAIAAIVSLVFLGGQITALLLDPVVSEIQNVLDGLFGP
jgi:hypothetical protein